MAIKDYELKIHENNNPNVKIHVNKDKKEIMYSLTQCHTHIQVKKIIIIKIKNPWIGIEIN